MYFLRLACILVCIVLTACSRSPEGQEKDAQPTGNDLEVTYAKGFSAVRTNGYWKLMIHSPYPNADRSFTYLLIPRDEVVPEVAGEVQVIRIPVQKLVATSTTHIPLLDYLDATNILTGFPNPDYISSEKMRQRINAGEVTDTGMDQAMEPETILKLSPDMIMAYSMSADIGQLERLRKAGIPYLLNADYLEPHPLGRAEWIKVAGLLLGKTHMADSVFSQIAANYMNIATKAASVKSKPTALSGVVYGDTWFMPGGNNYAARLMADAGIDYLWKSDSTTGFLELSFESVLRKANDAGLWIGVASFLSLEEMRAVEPRYAAFRAFQEQNVYSYTRRIGPTGGNEYLELGYLRPDLILGDLLWMAHPDLLPGHSMYFYQRLK